MTIQTAVKVCLARGHYFARPAFWEGSGTAIDLGRRLDSARTMRVSPLGSSGGLVGTDWKIDPTEFLLDWEVVTAEDLRQEACKTKD